MGPAFNAYIARCRRLNKNIVAFVKYLIYTTYKRNEQTDQFYIVTALQEGEQRGIGDRKRIDTAEEAIEMAKSLAEKRLEEGRAPLCFYVLQVVAKVGPAKPKIRVRKYY